MIAPVFVEVMRSCISPISVASVRLITHGRRHAAEKCGHFRTGLRKAENVVDEEKHVVSLIAEIFGDRQP